MHRVRLASTLVGATASSVVVSRRHNMLEHRTKGSDFMKHLDIYARRDPQLAPYLLREVDIEYKRKCRKVTFLLWVVILTMVTGLQIRLQGEQLHFMRLYADYIKAEQTAKDEDNIQRRKAFVGVMNVVKDAFDRDQKWTREDEKKAIELLK